MSGSFSNISSFTYATSVFIHQERSHGIRDFVFKSEKVNNLLINGEKKLV